jgi:hypothetical protein
MEEANGDLNFIQDFQRDNRPVFWEHKDLL